MVEHISTLAESRSEISIIGHRYFSFGTVRDDGGR